MKKPERLNEIDVNIILVMEECDYSVFAVASKLHYAPQTVNRHIRKICRVTGLSPRSFFQLPELVQIAKHVLKEG